MGPVPLFLTFTFFYFSAPAAWSTTAHKLLAKAAGGRIKNSVTLETTRGCVYHTVVPDLPGRGDSVMIHSICGRGWRQTSEKV